MTDLTTIAAVRAFANLTTADISDDVLADVVTRASAMIRGYCSRDITATDYTEIFDGRGTTVYTPKQYPVTAVASVTVDDISVLPGKPGFRFSPMAIVLDGYRFTRGIQNCIVAYTAGVATAPPEIEHAAILTVAAAVRGRERDPSVRSETDQAALYSASYTTVAVPEEAKAILNQSPYRRVY